MQGPSRRRFVTTAVCAGCCTALPGRGVAAPVGTIDQITDVGATAATNMFRFEPNLLSLAIGDSLAILNSRGEHTVHTVPDLWPKGVPPVAISNAPEVEITFPVAGFYGFRCRRHGQYGMVMLIAAGKPPVTQRMRQRVETMKAKEREKAAFTALFDAYATD